MTKTITIASALALLSGAALGQFDIARLGHLGGGESIPNDINNNGQVVGSSHNAGGVDSAFIWSAGVLIDPTLFERFGISQVPAFVATEKSPMRCDESTL